MNKTVSAKAGHEKSLVFAAFRGLLTALLISVAISAVCAFLGLYMEDPGAYVKIFAFISLFAGAFSGGFATARAKGSATLLCGLLTSLLIIALIAVISLSFSLSLKVPLFATCSICVLLCSVLGANVGISANSVKRKKKHGKNRV